MPMPMLMLMLMIVLMLPRATCTCRAPCSSLHCTTGRGTVQWHSSHTQDTTHVWHNVYVHNCALDFWVSAASMYYLWLQPPRPSQQYGVVLCLY